MYHRIFRRFVLTAAATASLSLAQAAGQQPDTPAPKPASQPDGAAQTPPAAANPSAPLRVTLQDAIALARKNDPTYHAAVTEAGVAREDRAQARDALLPSVSFTTSTLYTQPNNSPLGFKFIANNAPHEYVSQGNVHEQIDVASIADYRRTAALAALAKARAEIASRGLVVTVVQNYFAAEATEQKLVTTRRAAEEGERFLQITQDLEKGGEVAHSDVIKAELQAQDRRRQLQDAQLASLNARLDLAVLLFPDFTDNFELADDLHASVPLPPREEFEALAARDNPDIRAALSAVQAAGHDVTSTRAGYMPSVTLDYWYGIDAQRYATYETAPDGTRYQNLGSSAMASLTLPLWNWGATQSKVRQAELRREQSKLELSLAQRKLLAEMRSLYSEAETALNQQAGLQRSAQLAADSLRLTTLRYTHGESTVLEVVDAQSTFAQANAAYQDGALRYRVALANLQTLTGVLTAP
ncbi:MAG TPA: TolC family protein [Candidatus Saccharimonadales bacterium]|nr:TolC family protein [Candidatus Saccharimonadales bacterium]